MIGGNKDNMPLKKVYSSDDGIKWINIGEIPFPSRWRHTTTLFNNTLYVIGGIDVENSYNSISLLKSFPNLNDIWKSDDGINWTCVLQSAPFSPRAGHASITFKNELYIIGGYNNNIYFNEIWKSGDGYNWTMIGGIPFSPRAGFVSVKFKDYIYILGGYNGNYLNDIWRSNDLLVWEQIKKYPESFITKAAFAAVEFESRIYVMFGGISNNEVWSSEDGVTWEMSSVIPFGSRWKHTAIVFNNEILVIGGYDQQKCYNDVWAYKKIGHDLLEINNLSLN